MKFTYLYAICEFNTNRVGELNDLFGWNQHCKYFDAIPKGRIFISHLL